MIDILKKDSFLLINNNPFDHAIFAWAINDIAPESAYIIARNETEAFELLVDLKLRPSLIIADCFFPGFDAVRFLHHLRSVNDAITFPLILHCDPSDINEEVKRCGAHALYPKAYTPDGVRNLLLLYLTTGVSAILPN